MTNSEIVAILKDALATLYLIPEHVESGVLWDYLDEAKGGIESAMKHVTKSAVEIDEEE